MVSLPCARWSTICDGTKRLFAFSQGVLSGGILSFFLSLFMARGARGKEEEVCRHLLAKHSQCWAQSKIAQSSNLETNLIVVKSSAAHCGVHTLWITRWRFSAHWKFFSSVSFLDAQYGHHIMLPGIARLVLPEEKTTLAKKKHRKLLVMLLSTIRLLGWT